MTTETTYNPMPLQPRVAQRGDYVMDRAHKCLAVVLQVLRAGKSTVYELSRRDAESYTGRRTYTMEGCYVYDPWMGE